jgi:hypothetical protein
MVLISVPFMFPDCYRSQYLFVFFVYEVLMTVRSAEFVKNWVAKNATALGPSDDPMRASNLATRCIAEAAAEGITLEEIQPKTRSLESLIFDARVRLAEPGTPGE